MSGGSWNYACYGISDAASRMAIWDKELSELLEDLSHVCHDCEWADDSDISEEDARDAIKTFKAKWFETDREERLRGYVDDILGQARDSAYRVTGVESE